MDWEILKTIIEILSIIGGIATIFGLFLGPMFWLGSKIDGIRNELHEFKDQMHQEMKDFHGRLCAIEERRNK